MKILCAGDIHIGRRPSRLPDRVVRSELSCALAWSAMVDRAISEGVDLVALSGDLVDESNRYYEAIGPLESGIRKLAGRGIRTVAVAGNHDHDVLPRLADTLPPDDFTLLGRGGRWERCSIERDGRSRLHVDGWSFPQSRHRDDPLRGYPAHDPDGVPVLGLLHADLDQPGSVYAPVRLADLRRHAPGFWLLGHVHAWRLERADGAASVLYPGSPQAMDPGEQGVHGVWIAEIDAGGRFDVRQVPLATVRYESLPVSVDAVSDEGELDRRIKQAVARRLRECVDDGCGPLRYLTLRLRLTGRTAMHSVMQRIAGSVAADLALEDAGVTAVVDQVEVGTRPARDLAELARAHDAPGVLARLIAALESGEVDAEQERVIGAVLRETRDVRAARAYSGLPHREVDLEPEETRQLVAREAISLLDALLAQKEAV